MVKLADNDLQRSVAFCSKLFGRRAAKLRPGYTRTPRVRG
jgi:hypothetical protein